MTRVAINGFGRIGRLACKVIMEKFLGKIEIVAINDLTDTATLAHLLKYDTAYGTFALPVEHNDKSLIIKGKKIHAFAEKDPSKLPWKKLKVDVVLECTGVFRTRDGAMMHIKAGAKKVIISAPSKDPDDIKGYVKGVNSDEYQNDDIIDNASCTTNCTAPVVQIIDSAFGIEKAMLTTIHSYTSDQNLQDAPHKDLRRARAAAANIVPTGTGAAKATTCVLPHLEGKFDGMAVRVPTLTVSLTDFTFLLKKNVSVEEVNAVFSKAAKGKNWKGVFTVTNEPLVSSDFIGNSYSSVVDLGLTKVVDGNLVKVVAWYDNEWGYANRLIEMVHIVGQTL